MSRRHRPSGLEQLVQACEAGRDLPAILAIACAAVGVDLGSPRVAAYTLSEDGAALVLACGEGPQQLAAAHAYRAFPDRRRPVSAAGQRTPRAGLPGGRRPDAREHDRPPAWSPASPPRRWRPQRLWQAAGASAGTLDLLTGLPNHRGFAEGAARELSRAKRTGSVASVAVIDLDGFGPSTRCNGHAGRRRPAADGGPLLRRAACAPYDTVCRLGGDEFGLVLAGMAAPAAASLLSRLVEAFATSTDGVTASGGVAAFPSDGATLGELQRLATGSLYWAQRGGGGRVVPYDPAIVEALSARERADQLERDTYQRTMRALEAAGGRSATARAVADYAGFLAAELGLTPERADRLRLAAFVFDTTTPSGEPAERARLAARVAANAMDAEAAEWLLAPRRSARLADRVAHHRRSAAAFCDAGGHTGSAGAGRALAQLWQAARQLRPGGRAGAREPARRQRAGRGGGRLSGLTRCGAATGGGRRSRLPDGGSACARPPRRLDRRWPGPVRRCGAGRAARRPRSRPPASAPPPTR